MLVLRDLSGGPVAEQKHVVAIGALDGFHLGHQALLKTIVARANALGAAPAVVSFEPLPRQYFSPTPLLRLSPASERVRILRRHGIASALLLRFNRALSQLSAEQFIAQVLVRRLQACEVWIGPGFRFGHRRAGGIDDLQSAGLKHGFSVAELPPVILDGSPVSATRVRTALMASDFHAAERLLGRPYTFSGRVIRGQQLGRKLGYPTANLRWPSDSKLFSGIFAVRVSGSGLHRQPAIASLGTRPTVGGVVPLLEVHLFDFDGDLYGQRLEVEFVAKQRDELKFSGLDPLIAQMALDCTLARALLAG